jgi:F420-0:gamma-glutamyl ligase-like protein
MPILVGGLAGILIKIIAPIGDIAIEYIKEKIDASGITKQLARHQDEFNTAKQVWNIVEEKYRLTEKVEELLVSKSDMFDKLLLAKIPYLTQDNLNDLRQAIAGEFNKGKQAIITDESLKQAQIELKNENAQLANANNDLSSQNQTLQQKVDELNNKLNVVTNALNGLNSQPMVVTNPATVPSIDNSIQTTNTLQ